MFYSFKGVAIDATSLRRSLRVGSYTLLYSARKREMTLRGPDGREILRAFCTRKDAAQFAKDFGFPEADRSRCTKWLIYVPEIVLHDDGSQDANALETALWRSGLPYKVVRGSPDLLLVIGERRHEAREDADITALLAVIRDEAKTYADVIALWET